MRGDNVIPLYPDNGCRGSPPHARGQPCRSNVCESWSRFTPACAGTTKQPCSTWSPSSVHPRMRGDNPRISPWCIRSHGSPPHARGQLAYRSHPGTARRFTPACAGTTASYSAGVQVSAVHPRMRGDNQLAPCVLLMAYGSPPHARGQLHVHSTELRRRRFTPACAGTTSCSV